MLAVWKKNSTMTICTASCTAYLMLDSHVWYIDKGQGHIAALPRNRYKHGLFHIDKSDLFKLGLDDVTLIIGNYSMPNM